MEVYTIKSYASREIILDFWFIWSVNEHTLYSDSSAQTDESLPPIINI
jgi:hypothetical protein